VVLLPFLALWLGPSALGADLGTWEVLSQPSSPGRVYRPSAVALGPDGAIYVADAGDNRVQRVDASGQVTVIASLGHRLGEVRAPRGLAVDGTGSLYVADTGNSRILRLDLGGQWEQLASPGSGNGQVSSPGALACDAAGSLYVADRGNNRLLRRTSDGAWSVLAQGGGGLGQVLGPRGIAVDSQGNLYVTDDGHGEPRLQRRDDRGYWELLDIYTYGSPPSHLRDPLGLAVDADGTLYIADGMGGQVITRSSAGSWSVAADQRQFPGLASSPYAVAVGKTAGMVVVEEHGSRVQRFGQTGVSTLLTAGTYVPGQLRAPRSVAVDSRGTLYVTQMGHSQVDSRSALGAWVRATEGAQDITERMIPRALAVDGSNNLYLSCEYGPLVRRGAANGQWEALPGPLGPSYQSDFELAAAGGGALCYGGSDVGYRSDRGQWTSFVPQGQGLGQVGSVKGLAVDGSGTLYISDSNLSAGYRLQARSSLGEWQLLAYRRDPLSPVTDPRGLAVDGASNLYVADTAANRILVHSRSGTWSQLAGAGDDPGQVWGPIGLALDREGSLYVADSGNNRVQRFRPPLLARVGSAECLAAASDTTVTLPIDLLPSDLGPLTRLDLRLTSNSQSAGAPRDPRFLLSGGTQGWSLQADPADAWHATLTRSVEGAAPASLSLALVVPGGATAGATYTVAATSALADYEGGLRAWGPGRIGQGAVRVLAYIPGDVTGDGVVTLADVALVLRMCLLLEDQSYAYAQQAADVNGDGGVSIADALLILRKALDGTLLPAAS
jgi:DNA-binding beta-propeller fold protein YncE